ncbi:hypothetical protein [Thalassomonas haliotis]|uniref:Solute-binding protein family 3/N-terminal domain-containing protein n=1 Tax=Thalassomonas haliotis TaxID=485448 RepID=A0ABY7VFF9_9GAMM|nr:hypothetical protein [Thalassomonas haliotis]WDE12455.1 hypothetical protein H3N35_02935 [Thalassomonas haliotis]
MQQLIDISNRSFAILVMHSKQAIFLILTLTLSFSVQAESLFVFLPTQVRAKVMQQQISQICPELEVTVFGRGKDFRRQIKSTPPNAVLSLMPIIEQLGSFAPVLRGSKNGQTRENYVLVSVGRPLNMQDIAQKKIGVVDLLGRKPMGAFIADAFPVAVKLKRVTKTEDLLPLLTFGSVEAVLVSESHFLQLKAKSNLKLVASPANLTMSLVNLALNGANAKEKLVRCISRFDDKINSTLGVDKWLAMSK